ncbi:Iron-sulfur cluster carrier protein [Sphingomonas sp. T1]|jgi:ATP-binding protein involved in chromosome partitioning|uniref:Iron-sulfur cluster carrier protein n=1 Tax=Sphingomonas aerolata TaxID=185951 RepID=A0A2T4YQ10_9SPHN|nr:MULTISPECIES: Mrp/NBP35 family ATP-binding protein [Sphingomonas]MBD8638780.1 Mrp/NBP35 family ATP-binding protein [Sphingomonas sp. CFBP 13733]MBD8736375.1 Mrp/NBP35 family ATP-binding protein [Sphingomonas sp. CFBP 13706]PTM45589.1 ATP-binding protein involved in chromosome partitioning [Sphingomonas aerolata]VXC53589.1 Iron-sulfur cluster carrier protein [Sphingomonas sp. T1]
MIDIEAVKAAIAAVAGTRATVRLEGTRLGVVVDATGLDPKARDALEATVKMAATAPGVGEVRVVMTAERTTRRLIAVASGKGGVGKSTLSANLAIALSRAGRRVGLVDADIYGPSQPRLMGVEGTRPTAKDKVLDPVPTPYGVPLLSMGQLVDPGRALAWRGPMAAGALGQLVEADWGATDTLVLDLPPGTGDVQLTMVQKYRPAGAIIVSTPQDLALIDARRAIDLFEKAGIPIIGLVENMAGYVCPHCGESSDPFGNGGAEAAARELGIAFLGRVPLTLSIRTASDAGTPPAAEPDDVIFAALAAQVVAWIGKM